MPFQPGHAPYPGAGRPKGSNGFKSFKHLLTDALAAIGPDGTSRKEKIINKIIGLAEKGVPWACEFAADRLEGKPKVEVEFTQHNPFAMLTDEEIKEALEGLRMRQAAIEPQGRLEGPPEQKTAPDPKSDVVRPTDL
jgi:hypothetical protein